MVGIYKITNPKGKMYIGQSINIEKRFEHYKRLACEQQRKIYNSLKKYGPENHQFEIIEECKVEDLNIREIYWINHFNSLNEGLNLASGGEGGGIPSAETKRKMSESHKGKEWSNESKIKYGNSKTGHSMYNDEWREKIRKSLLGRKIEWNHKISKARKGQPSTFLGKTHSEETKKKMSEHRKLHYKNSHKKTPILQYDLEGNFIKEWDSIVEAKKYFRGDIAACVIGKQKTAANFIWKHKK